jgi:LPS-assembly protein
MALIVAHGAVAAQPGASVCPLGTFVCPVVKNNFALCKKNELLDFYVPGLPQTGNRKTAPIQVQGNRFSSPDSNTFHISGHAALERLDQLLRANSLTWDRNTTAYAATGNVRYQERGLLFSASSMQGTTQPEHGVANHVRYQLLTSRGNGKASQATILGHDRDKLQRVTYSTCELHDRVWDIEAKTITMNRNTGRGTARDLTMRVKGVPFLWLPWMSFPLDHRRQTGFLYPSFGKRGRAGFFFAIPFYWNLAPNFDATFTPKWFSKRGGMLDSQFRYLTRTSKGQLNLDYMPHDQIRGTDRGYLTFSDQTVLPGNLHWNTGISRVSDKEWFQDFGEHLSNRIVRQLRSSSYVTTVGDWWNAGVGADVYQIADPSVSLRARAYQRLPRLYFEAQRPIGRPGGPEWGLDTEAVRFVKDGFLSGTRFDAYPHIFWPLQGPAWFVRPEIGYRFTAYDVNQAAQTGGPTHPTRGLPIFDVDAGLIFQRDIHLFGHQYTQTLEPRVYYLRVPYRNQQDLPLFDTSVMTFGFWQLFTTNGFSGADRQENANNLSLALTTRFLNQNGVQKLSASIGQIRYFEPQRVTLFPGGKVTHEAGSDYVGNLTVNLSDNWRLTTSQQWNPHTSQFDVSTIGVQRRLWDHGIVDLSYRYRRGLLQLAGIAAEIPVSATWKLVGGYDYSIRDEQVLDTFAGAEWNSCCIAVQVLARHHVYDFRGDSENAIMFEIQFKGLGSYGGRTSTFLHNAILGYQ